MTESPTRLSFTSRDYATILAEIKGLIRETRSDLWSDFFDSNTGSALIEVAALVGDMLAYGQDLTAQELFLATCRRYESALRFARSVGYVPRTAVASIVQVRSLQLPDNLILYGGVVAKGATLSGQNGYSYELQEDYIVTPGDTVIRLALLEGTAYEEIFAPVLEKNGEIVSANGVVANGSWELYVGSTGNPLNLWAQVDNVQFESGPTKTYGVYFDDQGRLHPRFGDGNSGKIPDQNITLRYRTTNGLLGNTPAGTVKGALRVSLSLPATGTVSVEFENRDLDLSTAGGTQFYPSESQGTTSASAFQSGTLANTPVQAGTVTITLALPGGAGTVVLQDNGAGVLDVVSNSSIFTVLTTFITYSTGGWGVTFNSALPTLGPISADYYAIVAGSEATAAIIGAASGGQDRESLAELKLNIPAYIRSQDRVITLQDYDEVIRTIAGVALAYTDLWLSSYTANAVRINVWASETILFQSEDGARLLRGTPQSYLRYSQLPDAVIPTIVAYLRPRTLATVHNFMLRPQMLWVDVYLGEVIFDARTSAETVRDNITRAVLDLFQSSSGFAIRISELYNSIRDVVGVKYFQIQRVALGEQTISEELQGSTALSPTVSGTLQNPTITPKSVIITVEQTANTAIKLQDNGAGQFTVLSGVATVVSSSIDYNTGAWTVTFATALIPNQRVLAVYADVNEDRRRQQIVTYDSTQNFDAWPSPGTPTTYPVTPPYYDGHPKSTLRVGEAPFVVLSASHSFTDPTVTLTLDFIAPHNLLVGEVVGVVGLSPAVYVGRFPVASVVSPTTITIDIDASVDPGAPTFTVATVTRFGVLPPYISGDIMEYPPITDVVVNAAASTAHFYDETYLYNNDIYYDSVDNLTTDVRAINLRRLSFDLTAG